MKFRNYAQISWAFCGIFLLTACAASPSASEVISNADAFAVAGDCGAFRFLKFSNEEKSVLECDPNKPALTILADLHYVANAENPDFAERVNREILIAALSSQGEVFRPAKPLNFETEVNRYIAGEFKKYQATWTEFFEDFGHSPAAENLTAIEGKVCFLGAGRIGYAVSVTLDFGGAHPMHYENFLNFDATTGKRLTLADVFKIGYESELTKILTQKAMALEKVKTAAELSCEPRPTENFLLKENEIEFHFNPYEIAPYSRGAICVKIPYKELSHLLKF